MKLLIQRSKEASVKVNGEIIGRIKNGLVVFLGISTNDTQDEIPKLADKLVNLRLFSDGDKDFEKSILEYKKEILLVSQFTLYAECNKGRRPTFNSAAKSDVAIKIYESFIKILQDKGVKVATGKFGAEMEVNLTNDGPVTIILESDK